MKKNQLDSTVLNYIEYISDARIKKGYSADWLAAEIDGVLGLRGWLEGLCEDDDCGGEGNARD